MTTINSSRKFIRRSDEELYQSEGNKLIISRKSSFQSELNNALINIQAPSPGALSSPNFQQHCGGLKLPKDQIP